MAQIIAERMAGEIEGEFVVFLIGMRVNKLWKVWKWQPVAVAMTRMLTELFQHPELGLLHARSHFGLPGTFVVQYWRSFEHLDRYAKSKDHAHLPAWRAFHRAVASNGDVGIWHETYIVRAGQYEAFYNNMPPFGLGAAGKLTPALGRLKSAHGRLGRGQGGDGPDV